MKPTSKLLAFAFFGFMVASCNREPPLDAHRKAKPVETSQVPALVNKQNFYICRSPRLPFFVIFPNLLGDTSDQDDCTNIGFNVDYDPKIYKDYENKIGNYNDEHLRSLSRGLIDVRLKKERGISSQFPITENFDNYPKVFYNEDKPVWCFEEAKKTSQAYEVQLQGLVEQADGSFKKESLPADLYVSPETSWEGEDEPIPFPENAFSEHQYLTPHIPMNAEWKRLFLKVEYAAIVNSEPEHHKEAKRKLNLDLCRAARSFTWVFFRNPGPPDWSRVKLD